jgi:hypothetical protein
MRQTHVIGHKLLIFRLHDRSQVFSSFSLAFSVSKTHSQVDIRGTVVDKKEVVFENNDFFEKNDRF